MTKEPQPRGSTLKRIVDPHGPYIWLAYLVLYPVTWLGRRPDVADLMASTLGLLVFLGVYIWASQRRPLATITGAIIIQLIGFALIPTGGNWPVISIFAVSVAAGLRPASNARWLIAALMLASAAVAMWSGYPWYFNLLFAFFAVMVAVGKMSGIALSEKQGQLIAAQDEVRRLSREAERERIARDLHDLLGRTLTLIALKADLAAKVASEDVEAARDEMRDIAGAARSGLADVRKAVAGMTTTGLRREIEGSRDALSAAGIGCVVEGDVDAISAAEGGVLAMALREAVTNVIRHADATRCTIRIAHDMRQIHLDIADDGQGGHFREGAGIAGMRARMTAAGGAFDISATPAGTTVLATLPASA